MRQFSRLAVVLSGLVFSFAATGCGGLEELFRELAERQPPPPPEPAPPPPPKPEPCGSVTCAPGLVCCNASCGICSPPGGLCSQQICPPKPECAADTDCRTFSNYCDGCNCEALSSGERDPVCKGTIVQCLADPCLNKKAVCKAGQCVVATPTPVPPRPECVMDTDCRTFSNYCDGCNCEALAPGERDPVCNGKIVQCLVDPCLNKQAVCKAGQCAVATPAPPNCEPRTMGGPTSCKPLDVWKTYAADDCIRSGKALVEITPREDCGRGSSVFVDYVCCSR